jgi:hypothetical protein
MKLKIKKAELVPDKFGQHIKVTMIGLYDENDKWIRWVKLNDALIKELLKVEINIETK